MEFTCEFCNSLFSRKSNLINHQKTAKFCLSIQGKENNSFLCNFCNKKLTTKNALNTHIQSCKNKIENNPEELLKEIEELKESNLMLQKDFEQKITLKNQEIITKNDYIKKLEKKIEKLENTIAKIAERPTHTTTMNNNNNQRYQQIIQNLVPLTEEHYKQFAENFKEEHMLNGVDGYADYTYSIINGKVICTDMSRKTGRYKDEFGNIIIDPKLNNITTRFFSSIQEKNNQYTESHVNKLAEQLNETVRELYLEKGDDMEEHETARFESEVDKIIEKKQQLVYNKIDIDDIVKGKDNSLKSKYIEKIANRIYAR